LNRAARQPRMDENGSLGGNLKSVTICNPIISGICI
jgi:hypothetical protein